MNLNFEGRVARLTCGLLMVAGSASVFSLSLTAADATDQTLAGVRPMRRLRYRLRGECQLGL
jgi:hypothetical protein